MNLYNIPKGQQLLFSFKMTKIKVNEECRCRPDVMVNKVEGEDNSGKEFLMNNLNNTSPLTFEIGDIIRYPSQKFLDTFASI